MNDILYWVAATFAILLGGYAISDLHKNMNLPLHYRITMTVVILLLPVLGAVIYFKQKSAIASDEARIRRRHRR